MQENLTLEQQKKELQMTLSKFTHEIRNPVLEFPQNVISK